MFSNDPLILKILFKEAFCEFRKYLLCDAQKTFEDQKAIRLEDHVYNSVSEITAHRTDVKFTKIPHFMPPFCPDIEI